MTTTGGIESKSLATITVLGRLKRTPLVWLFALLCALVLTLVLMQGVGTRRVIIGGSIGVEAQSTPGRTPLVGAVDPRWGAQVRTGDEILALNGTWVDELGYRSQSAALPLGPVSLTLRRDGSVFEVQGVVTSVPVMTAFTLLLRWLTGVMLCLLGVGVFLLRPGAKLSWIFFVFQNLLGLIVMLGTSFPGSEPVFFGLMGLLFPATPAMAFLFLSVFPTELPIERLARGAVAAAVVFAVGNCVAYFVAPIEARSVLQNTTRIVAIVFGLMGLSAAGYQVWAARASRDERRKAVTTQVAWACFVGLFVPLLANSAVKFLGMEGGIAHRLSAISVLTFGVITTLTLVRHNPFEVDRYAATVVGSIATLGGLGAVFAASLFAIPLIAKALGLASSSEGQVAVTAVTFAAAGPVYRRLKSRVERWFSREQADALQLADLLRETSEAVQRDPTDVSLKKIVAVARVIGAEHSAIWQIDPSGERLRQVAGQRGPDEVETVARLGPMALVMDKAGGVSELSPRAFDEPTQQALWALGLAMSAPIRAHGVPIGFLGVGRRASGFGYRTEALSFLEMLAFQAGLALEHGAITRIGRYRVEKHLASGGMAEILVAWQLGPGGFERKVALKRLLPELADDPRFAAGLLDEARISSRLQHPNIAQVFEAGLEAGQHFIAMEFIDGPPLRALITNQGRLAETTPLPVALAVARALLSALDHAHQLQDGNGEPMKVVHRDVTPSNVLINLRGEPKLIDFGLVKANTKLFRTQTGVARGTVPYMSPEQTAGVDVDLRSDVYSASVTLYELFTGLRAFPEGPTAARPVQAPAVLSPALTQVFERGFAYRAEERFSSAGAMWDALQAAALPVEAGSNQDVARWMQRAAEVAPVTANESTRSISVVATPHGKG